MTLEFDWYQATLPGVTDPETVAARLLYGSGSLVLRPGTGGYNRPQSISGETNYGGSISIYFGNGLDVHVRATSAAAPHAAEVLREHFPGHKVSRVDVAIDFDEPGCFEKLWRTAHDVAKAPRRGGRGGATSTSVAGDWIDAEKGRTFYVGAPSAAMRIRVYEKGHELAAKHPDRGPFSLDLTRVEWQIRPNSAGKARAATATPEELAAWTPMGAALLEAVYGLQLPATAPKRVPATDALYWCAHQYGKALRELLVFEPELTIADWLERETSRVPDFAKQNA